MLGQELNCRVSVAVTATNKTNDPKIYTSMETAIREFMNNRKWTEDNYKVHEKIECSILINITNELSSESFEAKATIRSSRPVFKSSYSTGLLYHVDNEWVFKYSEFDPLEFNENMYTSGLTSMLAFYAYIIIGMDYDSFSSKGGNPYFSKAQNIVNSAQNSSDKGWKSIESTRNRYWIVENLQSIKCEQIRVVIYRYHRLALDNMYADVNESRKIISECLNTLLTVYNENPSSMLMQLFFNAKWNELSDIFSEATSIEKSDAVKILSRLDAARAGKYDEIINNK